MQRQSVDLAWAAGIIDGEGYIMIRRGKGTRRKTMNYQLYVGVTMVHKQTIMRLQRLFGGQVRQQAARDIKNHRPTYRIVWSDVPAAKLLNDIIPYTVTKKKQAKLGLQFRASCRQPLGFGGRKQTTPPRMVTRREKFFQQMKILNRRGAAAITTGV